MRAVFLCSKVPTKGYKHTQMAITQVRSVVSPSIDLNDRNFRPGTDPQRKQDIADSS